MANKPGRNAPCPCGSGVKYKRCCGRGPAALRGFTSVDRESALHKVWRFLQDPDWAETIEAAEELFWEHVEDPDPVADDDAQVLASMSQNVFEAWLFYDFQIEPEYHVVDAFLEEASGLSVGERRYLRAMQATCMRLYEVTDVRPGESISLRDVFTDEVVRVRERRGSQDLRRWTWVAARVNSKGASGQPEIDGGMLPLASARHEPLEDELRAELEWWAEHDPEASERQRWGELVPLMHAAWRSPLPIPNLVNYDGDPLVFTTVRFAVEDSDRLAAALDGVRSLERDLDHDDPNTLRWSWSGKGRQREELVSLGLLELRDGVLELTTNSVERGERGKKLIVRAAKPLVRLKIGVTEDARGAIERAIARGSSPPPFPELSPQEQDQLQDVTEEFLIEHYEGWVDEAIPALDGVTPRQAAGGSKAARDRLIGLLKDLERMYEDALARGEAAYDPTWIRDELGLAADLAAGKQSTPQPAHASTVTPMPALVTTARTIAERLRRERADGFDVTLSQTDLDGDLTARGFVRDHVEPLADELAQVELEVWLEVLGNFELHLRKLFRVDESLAWMLGATELDLRGEELQVPFASFAMVFTDRHALGLAERMLSREPRARLRGRILRSLTVYVTQPTHAEPRRLRLAFACDADDGQLPTLIVRELLIRPGASLDEILDGAAPGPSNPLEPTFAGSPVRRLAQLVCNAILYASSMRPSSPAPSDRPSPASQTESLSSDGVYFLPGTIDIGSLTQLKRLHRSSRKRRSIMQRTMVRGHWRRAAADWSDQRPRWIAPHWRGPAEAAIVERDYRLEP